jgi:glycosyltransferase involved in cell wall biosynthesis
MRALVGLAARGARRIFVLSEFVRSEFHRYYPAVPRSRVCVAYPGCGRDFKAPTQPGDEFIRERYALPARYVLSVPSIHPRKNLFGLLRVYGILARGMSTNLPPLVIAGQQYWGSQELESQARAIDSRLQGYVPQADLPAVYRSAQVKVYPSIYEGFGLPPLETMASGVPVVCGDSTSLPEVVGPPGDDNCLAALMVDVRNPESIADALARLLADKELHESVRPAGLQRAVTLVGTDGSGHHQRPVLLALTLSPVHSALDVGWYDTHSPVLLCERGADGRCPIFHCVRWMVYLAE